jgi:hypothetical protein
MLGVSNLPLFPSQSCRRVVGANQLESICPPGPASSASAKCVDLKWYVVPKVCDFIQ